jgi:hypothetical protein
LVYFAGALLILTGIAVLLSQLGILGFLLSALRIPIIVLLALLLIIVGFVLIKGARLIHYSPNYQGREYRDSDYKELTYENHDSWDPGKR